MSRSKAELEMNNELLGLKKAFYRRFLREIKFAFERKKFA
jgi:hypothetical protein